MRRIEAVAVAVISASVVIASCAGDGVGGVTTPTPVASSITITSSSSYLMLGQTETFTATIAFSDGTTQVLTGGNWGTDAAAVATVGASTGLVTSLTAGDVTIFVDAYGIRGTRRITVVPNYQGRWTGNYLLTGCSETGEWASWGNCSNVVDGSKQAVTLNLTQTGGTITGQIDLEVIGFSRSLTTLTTTVPAGGGLVLQATAQVLTTRMTQDWQLNILAGQLMGTVVQTATRTDLSGNVVIKGTMLSVKRFD